MSKAKLIQRELDKGRKIYKIVGKKRQRNDIIENTKQYFNKIGTQLVSVEEKNIDGLNTFMKIDDCKLIPYTT